MKIDFKKTIKYFNSSNVDDLEAINPYRDWKTAIVFSAGFFAVVLSADGYVLWKSLHVINENIVLEERMATTTTTSVISRASLSKAIEMIGSKEEQFKKPFDVAITDPSL